MPTLTFGGDMDIRL